jgi:hypothetical protein
MVKMIARPTDADVLSWWLPAPGPLTFVGSTRRYYSCVADVVYVSEDRGRRWVRAGVLPPRDGGFRASCRTLYATSSGLLYAGTSQGIYSSGDGGKTWSSISGNVLARTSVDFVVGDAGGALYVNGMSAELPEGKASYKSLDGGKQWSITEWGERDALAPDVPALVGLVNGKLYASLRRGLFVSSDGARTWLPAGNGIRQASQQEVGPQDVVTAVKADRARVYALTPRQLYKLDTASGVWTALGRKGIPER